MGLFNKKPDYSASAWLGYWDGPQGDASLCNVDCYGEPSMRGHIAAANVESVTKFFFDRNLEPPVQEMVDFAASAVPKEGETVLDGIAFPPGGPEFVNARLDEESDRWNVGFSLHSYPKKRALLGQADARYGTPYDPIMDDHAWAADKVFRAWRDYLRWVVGEAKGAGALITQEVMLTMEALTSGSAKAPGEAAWLASEQTKKTVDAAKHARAVS